MPTLSSMAIFFLFCISLNVSNGRKLRVDMNDGHKKHLQHVIKAHDQNAIILDSSLLNKFGDAKRGSTVKQIRVNDINDQKRSDSDVITEEMKAQRSLRCKDCVLHGHDSHVSVSYRVPRKNKGLDHHHPGFNLDYSPPKTHPPTHN